MMEKRSNKKLKWKLSIAFWRETVENIVKVIIRADVELFCFYDTLFSFTADRRTTSCGQHENIL